MTETLSLSGANWSDGGGLDGFFTIRPNAAEKSPEAWSATEEYLGTPLGHNGYTRHTNSASSCVGNVPEPKAEALGGLGLAMLFIFRRRR